ncbi:putative quinol monooxygenase [Spirosoma luteum]|uniref:putative quinol monooxygenase n=1 Tax=Spirosoma luteum TaxID=431553 RepID=UPI000370C750|nr:putative quinol monooxygenase [Spirosoma luteum]
MSLTKVFPTEKFRNLSKFRHGLCVLLAIGMLTMCAVGNASAQEKKQIVRLAKLVIDPAQLEPYKAALKEGAETAVRVEPGVLTLYAVSEKNNPTHFTILEIYADSAAYRAHLQTPHFLKYKNGTKDMVKSLELVETDPLVPGMKIK